MIPTPLSEEANDDDHETSDKVTTEPRRSMMRLEATSVFPQRGRDDAAQGW